MRLLLTCLLLALIAAAVNGAIAELPDAGSLKNIWA